MKIKFNEEKDTIRIDGVRLSYPHLFQAWNKEEGKPKKFSGRFILSEETHAAEIKALQAYLGKKMKEFFGDRIPLKNLCFRDGEDQGKPEYDNAWYLAASETRRPQLLGKNKEVITEEDGVLYPGCYVNVLFKVWKQANQHGKKINANLLAVQFSRDGERFGDAPVDVAEEFEDDDSGGSESSPDKDGFD